MASVEVEKREWGMFDGAFRMSIDAVIGGKEASANAEGSTPVEATLKTMSRLSGTKVIEHEIAWTKGGMKSGIFYVKMSNGEGHYQGKSAFNDPTQILEASFYACMDAISKL